MICGKARGLMPMHWLPPPDAGTSVCGGFDGSDTDDWTAIKLETRDGFLFTPRYGPDKRPTIWNPAEWGGTIPRLEVHAAWAEIADRYKLRRVYYDPPRWSTEGETWARLYGDEVFLPWPTFRDRPMHAALERFVTDLTTDALHHDGCPITTQHIANARKLANKADRYTLGKPAQHQKIDAAVTSVICHEAAADERAAGWPETSGPSIFFLS